MKRFFLIRHAHRDVFNSLDDNGLSPKGLRQSLALRDFCLAELGDKSSKVKILLLSSPRLRCQQTLQPLAEALQIECEIETLLDESAHQKVALDKRVNEFVKWAKTVKADFIFACSHGDWIPVFFSVVSGAEKSLKKSGLCEFKIVDDRKDLKDREAFKIEQIHDSF